MVIRVCCWAIVLGMIAGQASAQSKADTLAVWEALLHRLQGKSPIILDRRIRQLEDPQQLGDYHIPAWLDSLQAAHLISGTCDSNCFPGFQSDTMFLALGTPDFSSRPGSVLLFRAVIIVGGRSRCPEWAEEERDELMVIREGRWSRVRSERVTMGYFDSRCRPPVRYTN
jgi:hypothetical protein